MLGRIHSIESFGTVDGPGVRFVVFMKGCPLRCQYCHNPDTWDFNGGTEMSVEEILSQYERNRAYYKNGGLTVTGGEPLAQLDFVTELFEAARKRGIHTCLDTSGGTYRTGDPAYLKRVDRLLAATDLVMLDLKHIDDEEHKKLTGSSNGNIVAFARHMDELGTQMWIRHVVVPGITYDETYLYRLGEFIGSLHHVKALDVLPYHTMGEVKYEKLGIPYPLAGVRPLEKDEAVAAKKIILHGVKDYREKHQG